MANSFFGRRRFEREMNDELQLHIDLQTQAYVDRGMNPAEARRRAMIEFGSLDNVREEARETRALAWLSGIWRDVRIAVRGLLHEPGFSIVCVFILALAIGANTTVFSIINATFLRSLPYNEPDRIVRIWEAQNDGARGTVSYLNFMDWRARQNSFSQLAMCLDNGVTMCDGSKSARLQGNYVTEGYFELLGVTPAIGRDFTAKDDAPGAAPVALITTRTWREQFGGDPVVVGKSVQVDDRMVEIVGVLPENFRHYQDADIFIPLEPRAESMFLTTRNNRWSNTTLGRLAPGVDIASARAEIKSISASLARDYPENVGYTSDMEPLQESMNRDARERVWFLYGAVALFLLTACVNLANMFLARGMARTREMAVRAALGATRRQLMRQLLIESLVISAIGGALGIIVAWQASAFASQLIPWDIRKTLGDTSILDWRVCFFAVILTFAAGIFFGLAPALRLSQTRPSGALKEDGGVSGRKGRFSGSDILAIVQVALVAVLLVSSGLLVRSLQRILDTPPGINPEHLITFQIAAQSTGSFMANPNATARFYRNTLDKIKEMPGAENATFGGSLPYTWNNSSMGIYRSDRPTPEISKAPSYSYHMIGADFFRVMGISLLKGRVFDGRETVLQYPEGVKIAPENFDRIFGSLVVDCVVSKRMAQEVWPDEDPIGKRFHIGPPGMTAGTAVVVGVVGNTLQFGAEQGQTAEFYLPFQSLPMPGSLYFAVRTHDNPTALMRTLQASLADLLPNNPVYNMHLMEERMSWFVADRKRTVQMLGTFALASLLLAAAGIYGVLAYITARRNREIAIRLTLGATRRGVLFEVLRHGALLVAVGLIIGLAASLLVQRFIQSQLYGVRGTDPTTFLLGAIALMGIGLAACWVPAWRASKVDPMSTLRSN
jgi:putative ABC transport system permease protein